MYSMGYAVVYVYGMVRAVIVWYAKRVCQIHLVVVSLLVGNP